MRIVEDVTESIGSVCDEMHAGQYGDVIVCAFEEDGIISTAGGAAVVYKSTLGYDGMPLEILGDDERRYLELPDMNAALGIIQIDTLSSQLERRTELYKHYLQALMKTRHKLFGIGDIGFESNGYCFTVVLDSKPETTVKFATKYGVSTRETFQGCLGSPFTDRFDLFPNGIPAILRGISFPLYPFLKKDDVEILRRVVSHLP